MMDTLNQIEAEEYLLVHIGGSYTNSTISGDSIRTKDSEIWFFQVADTSDINYSPYELYSADGTEVDAMGPDSGIAYQQLYDSNGDDILRNSDNSWRVYNYSIGLFENDNVRVYPRIPDNQNGGAWTWLDGDEPDPEDGDNYGFVRARETDYENPSGKLESVVWRHGTVTPIQYGFYNPTNSFKKPIMNITGTSYELRPVEDDDDKLALLADIMRDESKRRHPIKLVSFSRNSLRTFSFTVPEAWESADNNLTISKSNLHSSIDEQIEKLKSGDLIGGDNGGDI